MGSQSDHGGPRILHMAWRDLRASRPWRWDPIADHGQGAPVWGTDGKAKEVGSGLIEIFLGACRDMTVAQWTPGG